MIAQIFFNLKQLFIEITPTIFLGFFLSGLIHEFLPQDLINRYFGKKDLLTLFRISILGIILPICCWGSLPIAVTLRKRGAPLGPILSFLVTTPATSISAILITNQLFGLKFTLALALTVVLMGMIVGVIGNLLPTREISSAQGEGCAFCAEESQHLFHHHHQRGFSHRIVSVFTYSFIDLPKELGLEILIGMFLAAAVSSFSPIRFLIQKYLSGLYAYLFALIFGLLMYICATASVPLVFALVHQGLNIGAGFVLLLVGPITSYGTILVIRKEFGFSILTIYLFLISALSLLSGYLFGYLFS
uniref:Permease n=1 Tax=candidate division WOR-3 bacterium TaxID=2052148 RepID=A0A7C3UPL6_UNCW3